MCVEGGGGGGEGSVWSLFCGVVLSSLAFVLLRKRELVALFYNHATSFSNILP